MREILRIWNECVWVRGPGLRVTAMLGVVFLGSLVLDQATKTHAQRDLLIYENPNNTDLFQGRRHNVFCLGSRAYVDGEPQPYFCLNYQYSRNKGAAFSMFSTMGDSLRVPMFYAITVFAVIFIVYFFITTTESQHIMRYGLAMILAGAFGNFIDRVIYGYVIDFIDVDWNLLGWQHDFAIFNIADVSINIGVYCMLIQMYLEYREKRRAPLQPEQSKA